jgi:hypothetical protein
MINLKPNQPPPLPSAAGPKSKFLKYCVILFGGFFLLTVFTGTRSQTSAPQKTASTVSQNDEAELDHDSVLSVITMLMAYHTECGGLPPAIEKKTTSAMLGAGNQQLLPFYIKTEKARKRMGNTAFCSRVAAEIVIAAMDNDND